MKYVWFRSPLGKSTSTCREKMRMDIQYWFCHGLSSGVSIANSKPSSAHFNSSNHCIVIPMDMAYPIINIGIQWDLINDNWDLRGFHQQTWCFNMIQSSKPSDLMDWPWCLGAVWTWRINQPFLAISISTMMIHQWNGVPFQFSYKASSTCLYSGNYSIIFYMILFIVYYEFLFFQIPLMWKQFWPSSPYGRSGLLAVWAQLRSPPIKSLFSLQWHPIQIHKNSYFPSYFGAFGSPRIDPSVPCGLWQGCDVSRERNRKDCNCW